MKKLIFSFFAFLLANWAWSQWSLPVSNGDMETASGFTISEFGSFTPPNANYQFNGGQVFVRTEARSASQFDDVNSGFAAGEGMDGSQAFKLSTANITPPNWNGWYIQYQTTEIDISSFGIGKYTFTFSVKASNIPAHASNSSLPAPLFPNVTQIPSYSDAAVDSRGWPDWSAVDSYQKMSISVNITNASTTAIRLAVQAGAEANDYFFDDITLTRDDTDIIVWDGSNWSNSTGPTANDDYTVIKGDLTISNDLAVNNLQVQSGNVEVTSGASLRIMGSATGMATVKRNTTGNMGYSIVGAPVSGADISALSADYLYSWDGSDWVVPTGSLIPGVGYFAGYNSASPEVVLTGSLVSGDQSVAVTGSGTSGHDGYNLIANPYAAAIAIDQFLSANTSVSGIYLWDDAGANIGSDRAGDYYMVNAIGSVNNTVDLSGGGQGNKGNSGAESGFIGSYQGFFVNVASDVNIDFTPAMQTTTSGANSDQNYYRLSNDQVKLKLSLSGHHHNEILFGFRDDATDGLDVQFDAPKKNGNDQFSFYSIMDGQNYAIQGLPTLTKTKELKLGYKLASDGQYQLSVADIENFPSEYQILAYYKGVEYNLTDSAPILYLTAGTETIDLILKKAVILNASIEDQLTVFGNSGQLNIKAGKSFENVHIQVMDITGKTLISLKDQPFDSGKWTGQVNLSKGEIYILRLINKEGVSVRKFIY